MDSLLDIVEAMLKPGWSKIIVITLALIGLWIWIK